MNKNGSASADVQDEAKNALARSETAGAMGSVFALERAKKVPKRRGGRRPRHHAPDCVRYFVGRAADGDSKPTLEQEVASEPEALIIAFKNDSRVYLVHEYRVTQQIEGDQVRLVKEPAASDKRASTTNES